MARDKQDPSQRVQQDQQAKQARLEAEWANVGLCGGMFRPARHNSQNGHLPAYPAYQAASQAEFNIEDWHPHNRCCH